MRRCLFINNSPQPGREALAKLGGGGKSLLGMVKALPRLGWRPSMVVPAEGQFTSLVRELDVPCTVFPYTPLSARQPLRSVTDTAHWLRILQQQRPDIIHANGFDISRSFALAAHLAGIPFLTHARFPSDAAGVRWTLRHLPKPAGFIFNSAALRERMWPAISAEAPQARSHVVHNAVDLDEFSPAPWPGDAPLRIGIVANFAPFKRHEDFLAMAAETRALGLDAEFWIIGDDTEGRGRREALEALAGELNIASAVRFLGHRSDVPDLIGQLHLLAVTSEFEPFGRVVIEAMACGRPVVATRDGGIPEIIDDGETGVLVPVGAPRRMAEACVALLADRSRWETFSQRAVAAANARFSLAAHVTSIARIYDQVLDAAR